MDSTELKRILPEKDIFEVNGRKIGLIHGSGAS
jgi:predicted phosphodiesterase